MPKGRPFKLPGFRVWLDNIKQTTAKAAAEEIVKDLITLGPWYSGQFAQNWVVRPGDVRVPATVTPDRSIKTIRESADSILPVVPSLRGTGKKPIGYTIANRVTYRDVALDLVPGRTEDKSKGSAFAYDWYRVYAEAGKLRNTLEKATGIAVNDPRVKYYKGPDREEV